jgi:hypothetical protein
MTFLLSSLFVLLIALLAPRVAEAQISVSNTFSPGGTIYSAEVNQNFTTLSSNALNRTGGTITGNISVDAGVTIDGVDLSVGFPQNVLTKSATYTVTTADGAHVTVLMSGTYTVNFYTAVGNSGRTITVKNIGTGAVTIDPNASETVDGNTTMVIAAKYQSLTAISDGSNWHVI